MESSGSLGIKGSYSSLNSFAYLPGMKSTQRPSNVFKVTWHPGSKRLEKPSTDAQTVHGPAQLLQNLLQKPELVTLPLPP